MASMVYCHNGVCEHNLMVLDVRLVDAKDDHRLSSYPIIQSEVCSSLMRCDICQGWNAEYVTYMDVHAPRAPCNWCSNCFTKWHGCEPRNSKVQVLPIVY
eukprot:TRINITY_DN53877_c0_g1_i1.p3 TRINITY_DN53877_c0_g1~~TRINITY_DN53877_c0_g1_i1.p3  ORF type:complete len:100 (+),score=7.57 TRINITY_DN53877_c0_g1_i1:3-302(+)